MLDFRKLQLSDIHKVRTYFAYSTSKICDNTVGGAFMWRDFFSVEFAEYNRTIIFKAQVKYHRNITAFSMPLGEDLHGSINEIVEYCRASRIPVAFFTVTKEDIEILQEVFPESRVFKEADWSDYIYTPKDLVTLAGRKFSGQRNHINYFNRTYRNNSFEELAGGNIAQARDFFARLSAETNTDTDVFVEEHLKTLEVLENYDTYGLLGGMLKVGGSVVAFSIGEIINNVLYVHIEKADPRYRGAFQAINNEFAKHYASSGVEFINREEDLGDEGLRISKISYHPYEIIDKYVFLVV